MNLSDYLAYVRSQALPPTGEFGTRSSLSNDSGGPGVTGTAGLPGVGDTSLGGRLALNADLNVNATSIAKGAFGLMGLLAGPLGGIASKAAIAGINAHNQAEINNALSKAGFKVGEAPPELVAEAINEALNAPQNNPQITMGLPGTLGHPAFGHQGFNPASPFGAPYGQARADEAPPAPAAEGDPNADGPGPGVSGQGGPGSGTGVSSGDTTEHTGGPIADLMPGDERRVLQEGEYVVRRDRAEKYRPLLEAINRGKPQQVKRALKEAMTA